MARCNKISDLKKESEKPASPGSSPIKSSKPPTGAKSPENKKGEDKLEAAGFKSKGLKSPKG